MSQRMGGCAAAWQAVRGVPESREHVVTGTGVAVGLGRGLEAGGSGYEIPGFSPHCGTQKNWLG